MQADAKTRIETNRAALTLVEEKRAKAELAAARAQQNIDNLVLKAPIDGLVVIRDNRDASGGMMFGGMTLPPIEPATTRLPAGRWPTSSTSRAWNCAFASASRIART